MTIRRTPEDFDVRETLDPAVVASFAAGRSDATPHAVYAIDKTSLTTPEAAGLLARELHVKPQTVEHAGLKDKHARTTQHVSVEVAGEAPAELSGRGWSARLVGWSASPATAAWIGANEFVIVVRDLSEHAAREMQTRAGFLRLRDQADASPQDRRLLFVNYFGDQRFGSARHGKGFVAQHLIKGQFEEALRLAIGTPARKDTGKRRDFSRLLANEWGAWSKLLDRFPRCPERAAVEALARGRSYRDAFAELPYFFQQMCVEAYQSYLWNAVARALVSTSDMLQADDDFGLMTFPRPTTVRHELRDVQLDLPAPDAVYPSSIAGTVHSTLASESAPANSLRIPGLRRPAFGTAPRPLFAIASAFDLSPIEADDLTGGKRRKRTVRMTLPRGAYATVVLRALGQ